MQSGIAVVLVLTSTFYAILIYVGFLLAIFSSMTVLGMMILRVKYPDRHRPYKTRGYPFTPILFVVGNLWIAIFSIQNNGLSFFWGMLTVAAGWIIYEYIEGRFINIVRFRNRTIL